MLFLMIFRFVFDLFIAGHLKCPKTGQVATFDLPCLFWCLVWSCSLFSVMSVMNEMNGAASVEMSLEKTEGG